MSSCRPSTSLPCMLPRSLISGSTIGGKIELTYISAPKCSNDYIFLSWLFDFGPRRSNICNSSVYFKAILISIHLYSVFEGNTYRSISNQPDWPCRASQDACENRLNVEVLLTQIVLPRVSCKLDDQQVSALRAASNTVNVRDVATLGSRPLQQIVHLSVGGVGELYDGAWLLRGQTGPRYFLSG